MVIVFGDFNFLHLSSASAAVSHEPKSSLVSFSGLCTIKKLLCFLRFFCVQEDALPRLPDQPLL